MVRERLWSDLIEKHQVCLFKCVLPLNYGLCVTLTQMILESKSSETLKQVHHVIQLPHILYIYLTA